MMLSNYLKKTFGWRNWAVFTYNSFIEHIFLAFYIALRSHDFSNNFLLSLLLFYLLSVSSTSYGYLINDFADQELDAAQGKLNVFQGEPFSFVVFSFGAVLSLALMSVWFFCTQPFFLLLWFTWLILATVYSLKPFRLKERGFIGLMDVVFAQRVLPTLLIFAAFHYREPLDVVLLTLYIFLRGIASDLNHQLEDYHADARTGATTFAVSAGHSHSRKIFRIVVESERVLGMVVMTFIAWRLSGQYGMVFYALPAAFGIAYLYSLYRLFKGDDPNPFVQTGKTVFQFLHHPFPTIILPLFLALFLVKFNGLYALPILLLVVHKGLFRKEVVMNSFLGNLVKRIWT